MATVFSLDNDGGGLFQIDATSGVISRKGTLTAGSSYGVAIRITDTATGRYTGFTDTITATAAVNITTGLFADGDSITRGYPLSDPSTQTWEAQFSQATGLPFYNGGVDGAKLVDIDTNWASDGNAARYNAANLNTYVQEAGTNDLRAGTPATTLISAIQSVIGKAKAAGFISYVATVMNDDQTGANATQKQTYNTWLRNNWPSFADGILDFQAAPELQDPNNTTYFVDKLHPTVAGQAVMARVAQLALTGSGSNVAVGTASGAGTASGRSTATATSPATGTAAGSGAASGVSPAPAGASTQWSATDKDPAITVTSPTRVDRTSAAGSAYPSIRATVARSTTRRYLEFTVNALASNTAIIVGIADAAASVSNYLGSDNHSMGFWSNGANILANSFPDYGIGVWAVGDVICLDWDPTAKTIRARRNNGAWGAALNISAMTAPFYPAATILNSVPSAITANFGDTAFTFAPPSGAVAWNVT